MSTHCKVLNSVNVGFGVGASVSVSVTVPSTMSAVICYLVSQYSICRKGNSAETKELYFPRRTEKIICINYNLTLGIKDCEDATNCAD